MGADVRLDSAGFDIGFRRYGIPVQSTLDAIRLTGQLEGMIIDPVYEGKSMAGLIDLVRGGEVARDSHVLYAHLGGQPALNAYSALFTHTEALDL
jgi:1-aminocyclopropane-1-carboxylate deaminase